MNFVKPLVRRVVGVFGYALVKKVVAPSASSSEPLLVEFLATIRSLGFSPKLIYDIGANRGVWSREFRKVFPQSKIVLFEPQRHLQGQLAACVSDLGNAEVRACAVSAEAGTSMFLSSSWDVTSRLASSSSSECEDGGSAYQVPVSTIDAEMAKDGSIVDLVKIDVEGDEVRVLAGAEDTLARSTVIVLEVGICCQSNENTALKIIIEMDKYGYDLMGIVNINSYHSPEGMRVAGLTWLADFAFVRRCSSLYKELSLAPNRYLK